MFRLLLITLAMIGTANAGSIGHAPYRGNAAPGMMNRGPEAGYFNRARPPEPLINPYGMENTSRPFDPAIGRDGSAFEDAPSQSPPSPPAGRVAPPRGSLAMHNGSLMRIVMTPDGYVDIFYERPRPGLPVLPGARLLRGKWDGTPPQNLVAVAFVFAMPPYRCPPIPYGVRGVVDQSDTLVLFGPAPVVAPDCRVIGHDWTKNSELRFTPVRP